MNKIVGTRAGVIWCLRQMSMILAHGSQVEDWTKLKGFDFIKMNMMVCEMRNDEDGIRLL